MRTALSKIRSARLSILKAQVAINDQSSYNVVELLQEALMAEFQQWDLYYAYKSEIKGLSRDPVIEHFEEHAADEASHIDTLQRYLVSMGEVPTKTRHPIPTLESSNIEIIIALQLKHEIQAIEKYKEILNALGDTNNPLRIEIENILTKEQEHAHDLQLYIDKKADVKELV